jgi:hypothetical protein
MALEAQSYKLTKDAQAGDVKLKLEALEMAMGLLRDHSKDLNDRIGALNNESSSDQSTGSPGGSNLGGVAQAGNDPGISGNAQPGAGATEGTPSN